MKSDFEYRYDVINDEWQVMFDGHLLVTIEGQYVRKVSDEHNLIEGAAARSVFADIFLNGMENEFNGFFVSAVLTKLFNNGINWSKEVK